MKIGSLYFDVDRNKQLDSEEICKYLEEYPEAELFMMILLTNNDSGFKYFECPMDLKKTDSGYEYVVSKDEEYDEMLKELARQIVFPFDALPSYCFKEKNKEKLHTYFVGTGKEESKDFSVFLAYDFDDNSALKQLFIEYLEYAKVRSMKDLLEEVKKARKIYTLDTGDTGDIFDFDYLRDDFFFDEFD